MFYDSIKFMWKLQIKTWQTKSALSSFSGLKRKREKAAFLVDFFFAIAYFNRL